MDEKWYAAGADSDGRDPAVVQNRGAAGRLTVPVWMGGRWSAAALRLRLEGVRQAPKWLRDEHEAEPNRRTDGVLVHRDVEPPRPG